MNAVKIEKQNDGGYILTDLDSGNSVYSGGLDGIVKVTCSYFKYPINYLIEDLQHDESIADNTEEKYKEFKDKILGYIRSSKDGIYQSKMFELLSNAPDGTFSYKEGYSPKTLIDELMDKNLITLVFTQEYMEGSYVKV